MNPGQDERANKSRFNCDKDFLRQFSFPTNNFSPLNRFFNIYNQLSKRNQLKNGCVLM